MGECVYRGENPGYTCDETAAVFFGDVLRAIDAVIAAHADWFIVDGQSCDGRCPLVREGRQDAYVQGVAAHLVGLGYCAIQDPNAGDEMAVKRTNAYSENYDILTADNRVRRGGGAYRGRCTPAWF